MRSSRASRTFLAAAVLCSGVVSGAFAAGEIPDGSVTYGKIAPGAVTNSRLADGVVTDTKIGFGAVTTPKIADGAVTDAKISGPISPAKLGRHGHDAGDIVSGTINSDRLNLGTTAGTVAAGDHTHDSFYQKKAANLIVVAKTHGDFADPIAALASITDASATTPYLVKIMPGVYDLGMATLQMKEYVNIEGSGEEVTTITGSLPEFGVVAGANHAEISRLTISARGSDGNVVALYNSSAAPHVARVTLSASGGKNAYGVYNVFAAPTLNDVTVSASGSGTTYGIFSLHSSPNLKNATVSAANGIVSYFSGTVRIDGSTITAPVATLYNGPGVTTYLATTRVDGGSPSNAGILHCFGVYDSGYEPVSCR